MCQVYSWISGSMTTNRGWKTKPNWINCVLTPENKNLMNSTHFFPSSFLLLLPPLWHIVLSVWFQILPLPVRRLAFWRWGLFSIFIPLVIVIASNSWWILNPCLLNEWMNKLMKITLLCESFNNILSLHAAK